MRCNAPRLPTLEAMKSTKALIFGEGCRLDGQRMQKLRSSRTLLSSIATNRPAATAWDGLRKHLKFSVLPARYHDLCYSRKDRSRDRWLVLQALSRSAQRIVQDSVCSCSAASSSSLKPCSSHRRPTIGSPSSGSRSTGFQYEILAEADCLGETANAPQATRCSTHAKKSFCISDEIP